MTYQNSTYEAIVAVVPHDGDDGHTTITAIPVGEEGTFVGHGSRSKKTNVLVMSAIAVATLLVALVLFSSSSSSNNASAVSSSSSSNAALDVSVPLEGMASPAAKKKTSSSTTIACTFDECLISNCDADAAPYLCLFQNGGPHGGCSPVAWSDATCEKSCNVAKCATMDMPSDVPTCVDKSCSKEWCATIAGAQRCGPDVPYQCTEGPGRFGCSSDAYHWVLSGCECCDVATCDE